MNKDIEKALSSAVNRLVPDDAFLEITKGIASADERSFTMTNKKRKGSNTSKWLKAAAVIIVLVAVSIFGAVYYDTNFQVDSIVDIDVNPSIEIATNKKNVVLDVKALNEDALVILNGMDLKKLDLDVAVNAIIGSMVRCGYLVDGENGILISVRNDNETKAHTIRNMLLTDINSTLEEDGIKASVINQTVNASKETETFAKTQNISYGKAAFILKLLEKGVNVSAEDLANMTLRDIAAMIIENDISIKDIVDYDEDDSVLENIKDNIKDTDQEQNHKPENSITLEEAKKIALNDAGVENVTFTEAKFDHDNNKNYYELEFYKNGVKYDYEIDCVSGAILDKEIEGKRPETSKDESTPPSADESNPVETKLITLEEAKQIALNDAHYSESDVVFTKTELYDGLRKIYDIEFKAGEKEWDYEINAKNGKILAFDSELDDDNDNGNQNNSNANTPDTKNQISASEAKNIALDHAGLKTEDVVFAKVELDRDDGKYVFEIEFISGKYEYDYEIDAENGNIIEHEREDFD